MQAGSQVPQGGSQRLEGDLLRDGGGLPEALEGQRDVVRFALQATGRRTARVAPDWLLAHSQPEWVERYEARMEDARTPLGDEARHAYAEVIGADGASMLSAIYEAAAPGFLREIPAVQILRQVWVQNYNWTDGQVRWRSSEDIPPAARSIGSPYDVEAHYSKKRSTTWVG
jgi:transposase